MKRMSWRVRDGGAAERHLLFQLCIEYKNYRKDSFTEKFCVSYDGKVDSNSCTYWYTLRCLPKGFFLREHDSYLCFCVFLVKKPD